MSHLLAQKLREAAAVSKAEGRPYHPQSVAHALLAMAADCPKLARELLVMGALEAAANYRVSGDRAGPFAGRPPCPEAGSGYVCLPECEAWDGGACARRSGLCAARGADA